MPQPPRLSIGMPVYNGEAFLEQTLQCLRQQTFRDFELVVCDNASTDDTEAIVRRLAAEDARIRYERNARNIGANANFTRVAQLCQAPLFKWAAHDDLYAPTYLERCVSHLDADPDVVLAHSDTTFIDEAGKAFLPSDQPRAWLEPSHRAVYTADPIDLGESSGALRRFAHVVFGSLWGTDMFGVIRRSALARTALIQDVPNSDRPLLAELALLGRFAHVREPLFLKRFHSRMTLALSEAEIAAYVSADNAGYSKRYRQLRVYLSLPNGKPVSWPTRTACRAVVLAYSAHVSLRSFRGRRHQAVQPATKSRSTTTATGVSP